MSGAVIAWRVISALGCELGYVYGSDVASALDSLARTEGYASAAEAPAFDGRLIPIVHPDHDTDCTCGPCVTAMIARAAEALS